jgi:hypothetical protein
MVDIVASASGEAGQGAQGAQNATPVAILGADLKFSETWRDSLPEEIRGEKSLLTFSDLPGMAKQLVNAQKMIGADKIVKPTDKSTPEDWEAYYAAGGRPAAATDYKVVLPEALKEHYDEKVLGAALTKLHAAGLTQKQVDVVLSLDGERLTTGLAAQKAELEGRRAKGLEELQKRIGGDVNSPKFKEAQGIIHRVLAENMQAGDLPAIQEAINDNPQIADLLIKVGRKFLEDSPANPDSAASATVEERIKELRATPGYGDGTMARAKRDEITNELTDLYKKITPAK